MTTDFLAGIGGMLAGAAIGWLGLYAYIGRGAPTLFRRAYANSFGLVGRAVIVFLLPAGIGFTLIGIAFLVGKNAITSNMLVVGLGFVLLAWLLFFVHPRFAQPKWLRTDEWIKAGHVQSKRRLPD